MANPKWIHVTEDNLHIIASRCDFTYPHSTEDSAGKKDEKRSEAIGHRDGDIVITSKMGWLDMADFRVMLDWKD
jgi:hypothetical protein